MLAPWKKSYDQPRQHIKKQRHCFANKCLSNRSYGFSSSYVWMWELDYKESWTQKNWCFWTVGLEKTLESPLDCKEIQPVYPQGKQSCIFIERTDAEAETNTLATRLEELTHSKRPWWKRRGCRRMRWFDGMTNSMDMSWVNSRSWWWTERPGMLQFMGSQRVGHDRVTELNLLNWWMHMYIWYTFLFYNILNGFSAVFPCYIGLYWLVFFLLIMCYIFLLFSYLKLSLYIGIVYITLLKVWISFYSSKDFESLTLWTWVWVSSRSWWWTGKPGMLQSMGSQRVRHNWATELNWAELRHTVIFLLDSLCSIKAYVSFWQGWF